MRVLAVNGGNGVIVHPFEKSKHFIVIGNVEPRSVFHTKLETQWYLNFDSVILQDFEDVSEATIDVIIGAPDCGHSSILALSRGKKFSDPHDNKSVNLYFKALKHYKPKFFLLENLSQFLTKYSKEELAEIFSGYKLIKHNCSVSKFGNSQISRKRLIIIGIRNDLKGSLEKYFQLDKQSYNLKKVNELESNLVYPNRRLCHIRETKNKVIAIYGGKKMSLRKIRKEWLTRLKGKSRWACEDRKYKTAPGVYRNLPNEYPMTARKALRQFNSKGYHMTPRELARMQGVPDNFKIWYDSNNTNYCLNKARITVTKCPPYEIGLWFKNQLTKILQNEKFGN